MIHKLDSIEVTVVNGAGTLDGYALAYNSDNNMVLVGFQYRDAGEDGFVWVPCTGVRMKYVVKPAPYVPWYDHNPPYMPVPLAPYYPPQPFTPFTVKVNPFPDHAPEIQCCKPNEGGCGR